MNSRERGFTLIELMVVVTLIAMLLAVAVPAFSDLLARRRLEGAANELSADLQFTRAQAVADNTNVTLSSISTTTYAITGNQTYKTVTLGTDLSLDSGVAIAITPLRGCTNAACDADDISMTVASSRISAQLRVTVNKMGRVLMCSPSGTFGGYPTC